MLNMKFIGFRILKGTLSLKVLKRLKSRYLVLKLHKLLFLLESWNTNFNISITFWLKRFQELNCHKSEQTSCIIFLWFHGTKREENSQRMEAEKDVKKHKKTKRRKAFEGKTIKFYSGFYSTVFVSAALLHQKHKLLKRFSVSSPM